METPRMPGSYSSEQSPQDKLERLRVARTEFERRATSGEQNIGSEGEVAAAEAVAATLADMDRQMRELETQTEA